MNQIKTVMLLGLMTGLLVVIGGAVGGRQGALLFLLIAAVMNFSAYWFSDKMVLRRYNAQPVDPGNAPGIYQMVRELADGAKLPMPKVYLIPDQTPNAFATGRNPEHAVVAVTSGIVDILNARELKAVLGHEMAHVKNRDILIGSVAATIAGAVMWIAHMAQFSMFFGGGSSDDDEGGGLGIVGLLLTAILAPLAAALIQMAISRSREYLADRDGARLSQDPAGLASALAKLAQANEARPMRQVTQESAHIFTVSPLSGRGFASLFSTHPPIQERISRLREMAGGSSPNLTAATRPAAMPPEFKIRSHRTQPPGPNQTGGPGSIDWS